MSTIDLAKDFVGMLKQHDNAGAAAKYNADSIASYEPMDGPMAVCKGKAEVMKKSEWWVANHEMHSASAEGPFVNGDQFVVRFKYDVTPKSTGKRMQMDEVGIYTVKNGKIVEERFCYLLP